MTQLVFAYLPIVVLIYLMTKKKALPSFQAIPITALMSYFIMLVVFEQAPNLVHAVVLNGLLVAWTPITIIAGAIFLFKTMEATGSITVIQSWLNSISSNPIAQLLIVGWAFQFLIEGASGFGTPAAIAAPILVALGFPPIRVAIFCLTMNSVPVSFGAVGTPVWFGFSVVELTEVELTQIAIKTSVINSLAALPVVLGGLFFVVSIEQITKNIGFIVLSILACTLPYIAIAHLSFEFPSLIGGMIGLVITIALANYGLGLSKKDEHETGESPKIDIKTLTKATFPLWGAVLILIVTRIPALGLKDLLQLSQPALVMDLGSLGTFSVSASLMLNLSNIFMTSESWSHSLLYIPSIIPFVVIALMTFALHRSNALAGVAINTLEQMKKPVVALLAALVFVNLMMMGEVSAVSLIGQSLADLTGEYWSFFAPFLGALGSFFSGSATISNLTFAGIQESISAELGLDRTSILALQTVGAALGNMVCINNIVAVASVLALTDAEGYILKRTAIVMCLYGVIAGVLGVFI